MLLQAGLPVAAMVTLLPWHLAEHELPLRVHLMVAAGAAATAPLAPAAVQDLVAAQHADPVGLMVDLLALLARLAGGDGEAPLARDTD